MCVALIQDSNEKDLDFIFYNYVMTKEEPFTSDLIKEGLREEFNINMDLFQIVSYLNYFVKIGILKKNLMDYALN